MPAVEDTTVLIWDQSAGFTHIARALVGQVRQVLYFSIWDLAFPRARDILPGVGIEGVERVPDFFEALPRADWCLFTDVGNGGLQEYLRQLGIPVCGSGRASELERDRWLLKVAAREAGLTVSEGELVHGLEELRDVLSHDHQCFVKLSYFRGDCETYHHRTAASSRPWLDDLALKLGPAGEKLDFIVEDPIAGDPCVEIGVDSFCVDGQFPETTLWGYEVKDAAFLGFTTPLPPLLLGLQEQLGHLLAVYGYRGPISTEFRVTPDAAYLIDLTCRFGSPPSELQSHLLTNLAEVLYGCALGESTEPVYRATYGAQLVMGSGWGAEHALGLEIEHPDRVALHGHCLIDGQDFTVSPSEIEEFGGAVGWGETADEAIKLATEAAEGVKAFRYEPRAGAFDEAKKAMGEGETLGLGVYAPGHHEAERVA